MFKQEFKEIIHSKWMVVVLCAIILIPSIYACIFLGSMWDPYGNSGDLPVAIVNKDQEVLYNDNKLHVGEDLVDNLSHNDSLDFHFVDEQTAKKGLEDGKYYMIITIPEDFSSNATTLLDKHPQKMILHYTSNPGKNYVAEKMSDTAVNKIRTEVSQTVSQTYAKTLFESVDLLSNGLNDASEGSYRLNDGLSQLNVGSQKLSDNLKILSESTLVFSDGIHTLSTGLKDYTDGVLKIQDGIYSLKNGINTLNSSNSTLANAIGDLNTGGKSLYQGINQYTHGVNDVYQGINSLTSQNDKLNEGVQAVITGVNQLQQVQQKSNQGLKKFNQELSKGNAQLKEGLSTSSKILSNQMNAVENDFMTIKQEQVELANSIKSSHLNPDEKAKILSLIQNNSEAVVLLSSHISDISTTLNQQSQSLNQFQSGLQQALQQLDSKDVNRIGLIQASDLSLQGIDQLKQGLTDQKQGLQAGIKAYTNGTLQVQNGLKTLTTNNTRIVDGSNALSNGLGLLESKVPVLVNGVSQLNQGAHDLYNGASVLSSHNDSLLKGSQKLIDGTDKIQQGSNQLYNGSLSLNEGLKDAHKGSEALYQGLKKGANDSRIMHNDDTIDMMVKPVSIDHKEISHVENNGHAMAPYMMSVALYVVAMAFVLMYPIRQGITQYKNSFKYWAVKATVMFSISTLSAILMVSALRFVNGFDPENIWMTYLFAIIVGAAFMSIVMLLSLTTGHIGEFILLVFMILNLGGSAGTYPLDTSGAFFKAIHSFVPYTYSVDGFRKVISMSKPSLQLEFIVLIGIIVVCSLLTILYFKYKNKEDHHIINEAFKKVND